MLLSAVVTAVAAAYAQAGDSSRSGDVVGNLPFGVYLLIPLALGLALLTAIALGPRGEPEPSERRAGGVTRALGRRAGALRHKGQKGEHS